MQVDLDKNNQMFGSNKSTENVLAQNSLIVLTKSVEGKKFHKQKMRTI